MASPSAIRPELPELPLAEWEATTETLHLWLQIVGKVRLALAPPRNHWWHVTFRLDARGLTTGPMEAPRGTFFQLDFDFVDHRLLVRTDEGAVESFELVDGLSVAAFYDKLRASLRELGIAVSIRGTPYGIGVTTPFAEDTAHASYDRDCAASFWRTLSWTNDVFEEFAGWYVGKTSPVQLFWHGFDLAVTRFSGRPAPVAETASAVTREAYSHEVISFGFWAGDAKVRVPTYYSYTWPEPPDLVEQALQPAQAGWVETGSTHQARLSYDDVRTDESPRAVLLDFLQSAYEAGAKTAGWDVDALRSHWAPGMA
jgi:Family of unknown function (DUF5996)